ncbi:unnamed protein product [Amoebophrya sp. A25]|nr:unnamed protein product [Amoebophrya sp. A25]|eukprot:GSA25T00017571001.1
MSQVSPPKSNENAALAREQEAGITGFVGSGRKEQLRGVFKQYYFDFHVHEVGVDGTKAQLTEVHDRTAIRESTREAKREATERKARFFVPTFAFSEEERSEVSVALMRGAKDDELEKSSQAEAAKLEKFLQTELQPREGFTVLKEDEEAKKKAAAADLAKSLDENGLETLYYVDLCVGAGGESKESKETAKNARKAFHDIVRVRFAEVLSSESSPLGLNYVRVWRRDQERKVKENASESMPLSRRQQKKKGKGKKGEPSSAEIAPAHNNDMLENGELDGPGGGFEAQQAPMNPALCLFRQEPWPRDRPDNLLFILYKENRETGEAINSISRSMSSDTRPKNLKSFGFAGTKDRRGCTTQFVTLFRTSERQLLHARFSNAWDPQVYVQPVGYVPDRLRLGKLKANRFDVLIRNLQSIGAVDAAPATSTSSTGDSAVEKNVEISAVEDEHRGLCLKEPVAQAFATLESIGFLNFFGLQRFGSGSIRTHEVGALLLQRKFKQAMLALLANADFGYGPSGKGGKKGKGKKGAGKGKQSCEAQSSAADVEKGGEDGDDEPAAKRRKVDTYADAVREERWADALHLMPRRRGIFIEQSLLEALSGQCMFGADSEKGKGKGKKGKDGKGKGKGKKGKKGGKKGDFGEDRGGEGKQVNGRTAIRDPRAVLEQLPRETVSLYYHALQSYCFNRVLARRRELFGIEKPVVGDLVFVDNATEEVPVEDGDTNMEDGDEEGNDRTAAEANAEAAKDTESQQQGGDSPAASSEKANKSSDVDSAAKAENNSVTTSKKSAKELGLEQALKLKHAVKALTEADLDQYTIEDVVLPLPGFAITYPEHLKAEYDIALCEIMHKNKYASSKTVEDGTADSSTLPSSITLETFGDGEPSGRTLRGISLPGGYRKCVVRPTEMSWDLVSVDESQVLSNPPGWQIPRVESDLGKIQAAQKTQVEDAESNNRTESEQVSKANNEEGASNVAATTATSTDTKVEEKKAGTSQAVEGKHSGEAVEMKVLADCEAKSLGEQVPGCGFKEPDASTTSAQSSETRLSLSNGSTDAAAVGATGTGTTSPPEATSRSNVKKVSWALRFSCTLPTSAYLTMALRELTGYPVD